MRAHTVQRGGGLTRIARNGRVYQIEIDFSHRGTRPKFIPRLRGIREAMTFRGFCNLHDTELFRPIEAYPIGPTDEQAVLLGYRAICFEIFQKTCHRRTIATMRKADRGKNPLAQYEIQQMAQGMEMGTSLGLRDMSTHKGRYEQAIGERDFSGVGYLAFHLDRVPDVICSGSCNPEFDFAGQRIQSLADHDRTMDSVDFCTIPTDQGGMAVIAWLGDHPATVQFARSLWALPDEDVPDALVRLMFEYFENLAIAPDWWESLPSNACDKLLCRAAEGNLFEQRPKGLLNDGLRTAAWRVAKRTSRGLVDPIESRGRSV